MNDKTSNIVAAFWSLNIDEAYNQLNSRSEVLFWIRNKRQKK